VAALPDLPAVSCPAPSVGVRIPEPKQRQEYADDREHHGRNDPTEYERDDEGDEVQTGERQVGPPPLARASLPPLPSSHRAIVAARRVIDAASYADPRVLAVVATPVGMRVLVARFFSHMVSEKVQVFWGALQRGEFITDAAEAAGTYRKQGTRWACLGRRPSSPPRAITGDAPDTNGGTGAPRITPKRNHQQDPLITSADIPTPFVQARTK